MRYMKTRTMSFSKAVDEALLRIAILVLRGLQAINSIFVLSAMAVFINDISTQDVNVPRRAVYVIAIACMCATYAVFAFLPTFCCGALFFATSLVFDLLFFGAWIASAAVLDCDATDTCHSFQKKYFGSVTGQVRDCNLFKAMFAFSIINM